MIPWQEAVLLNQWGGLRYDLEFLEPGKTVKVLWPSDVVTEQKLARIVERTSISENNLMPNIIDNVLPAIEIEFNGLTVLIRDFKGLKFMEIE